MSDQTKPACVSRRTVLIVTAGAAPLLALMAPQRRRSEIGADRGEISAHAQGRQTVQRLQPLHRPQLMQVCRGRYRSHWMVLDLGEEGGYDAWSETHETHRIGNDR